MQISYRKEVSESRRRKCCIWLPTCTKLPDNKKKEFLFTNWEKKLDCCSWKCSTWDEYTESIYKRDLWQLRVSIRGSLLFQAILDMGFIMLSPVFFTVVGDVSIFKKADNCNNNVFLTMQCLQVDMWEHLYKWEMLSSTSAICRTKKTGKFKVWKVEEGDTTAIFHPKMKPFKMP